VEGMVAQVVYGIDSDRWHWQYADDLVEVLEDQTALYNMGDKKPGLLAVPGTDDDMDHKHILHKRIV
jgi:hypothetical protein